MTTIIHFILCSAIILTASKSFAVAADLDRQKLQENQRNIIHLRKERLLFQRELKELQLEESSPELEAEISDIKESIEVADTLIENISEFVSEQRLALSSVKSNSSTLSALDIALNKALNSNLPALAKNLSQSKGAREEIVRLRKSLQQQARLKPRKYNTNQTKVSIAPSQAIAQEEFLRLLSLFSNGNVDEGEDKIINISGLNSGKSISEDEILSYLGHNQYHMETTVYTGMMTFTVDNRPWYIEIDENENGATYVIIYDTDKKDKPRLVMFNKGLLSEDI